MVLSGLSFERKKVGSAKTLKSRVFVLWPKVKPKVFRAVPEGEARAAKRGKVEVYLRAHGRKHWFPLAENIFDVYLARYGQIFDI